MTSTVTKSSIIDDLGVRDPPLVCLFPVQNITKRLKLNEVDIYIYPNISKGMKHIQSHQLRHQNGTNFVVLVSLLLTLNVFYTLFQFFYFNYEQANAVRHMLHSLSCI